MSHPRNDPSRPTTGYEPRPAREATVIGETMYINGELRSQDEVVVAGKLDGSVESAQSLTVGPNGKVKAKIKARAVTIHGTVLGSIEVTEKIVVHQEGSLIGDVKTAGIVIDDGAYFKGSIDIIRPAKAAAAKAGENG